MKNWTRARLAMNRKTAKHQKKLLLRTKTSAHMLACSRKDGSQVVGEGGSEDAEKTLKTPVLTKQAGDAAGEHAAPFHVFG